MRARRHGWMLFAVVALACGQSGSAPRAPVPPRVTGVRVDKSDHRLELLDGDRVVFAYTVAIGKGGAGPKTHEGDNVTPTGRYVLHAVRPSAKFHAFIPVSYPNDADRKRFAAAREAGHVGRDASIGGDIGIHGVGGSWLAPLHKMADWTRGCIAVDNDEIDEIASLVHDGTPIQIED